MTVKELKAFILGAEDDMQVCVEISRMPEETLNNITRASIVREFKGTKIVSSSTGSGLEYDSPIFEESAVLAI